MLTGIWNKLFFCKYNKLHSRIRSYQAVYNSVDIRSDNVHR